MKVTVLCAGKALVVRGVDAGKRVFERVEGRNERRHRPPATRETKGPAILNSRGEGKMREIQTLESDPSE